MGRYIRIIGGKVISMRMADGIVDGEVESDTGEVGQTLVDGEWVDPPLEPVIVSEMELRIAALEAENLTVMEAVAEVYEMVLAGGA